MSPLFDDGAYDLSQDELDLIREVSYKLGMLRIVIRDRDLTPDQVHPLWEEEKARSAWAREALRAKIMNRGS